MCGINGFNWSDPKLIQKMNASIKHRGPDNGGVFTAPGISLGHVRLSILDLSEKARQPMSTPDGSIWITYNGEIYNFKELRARLETKGVRFTSDSDTEVILHSYKQVGIDCVKEFNGIFSFCIFDKKKNCLYLTRDRLGIKPLYYYLEDGVFVFSSEPKAFMDIEYIRKEVDRESIAEYLTSYNITSGCFLKRIKPLQPGTYLRYDLKDKNIMIGQLTDVYDAISKNAYEQNKQKSEKKLIDELDALLNNVVKDQLVSDAPLGTICSGGLDSSLVTAIASRYIDNIKLFNVRVEGVKFDESVYAKKVASHLGLSLIEEPLNKETYLGLYKDCIRLEDLPLTHPNSVGILLISQRAKKEKMSVLLSGEGADELFGGYHHYRAFYKACLMTKFPVLPSMLKKIFTNRTDDHTKTFLSADPMDNEALSIANARKVFLDLQKRLSFISNEVERETLSFIMTDMRYYLVPILRRTDRMSMGSGIEMRVPYLDNRLIDFTLNLPLKYKIRYSGGKYLLKKVAERYLPRDIIYRKKMGFPVPIDQWLNSINIKEAFLSDWKSLNKGSLCVSCIS